MKNCVHICVWLIASQASLPAFGQALGRGGSKLVNASPGTTKQFTFPVSQDYCDVSPQYSYKSIASSSDLPTLLVKPQSQGWQSQIYNLYKKKPDETNEQAKADGTSALKASGISFVGSISDSGGVDDPPSHGTISDSGGPLLYVQPGKEFHENTYDAQRLLIRTLVSPNILMTACSSDNTQIVGADGKPLTKLGQGVGYTFSLNATNAPKYYLINIVRWKDATPPKPSGNASKSATTTPYFQVSDEEWYLLNYSDSQDRMQDITKWFYKITPSMVSSTLRVIGKSEVVFLGIHLAPTAANPQQTSGPNSPIPTEQAWFDGVSLQYTFKASSAQSVEMKDLGSVLQIVLGAGGSGQTTPPQDIHSQAEGLVGAQIETGKQIPDALKNSNYFSLDGGIVHLKDGIGASTTRADELADEIKILKTLVVPTPATYQGRYAAGLINKLTSLPVTLSGTWTASFNASPLPSWSGDNVAYAKASDPPPDPANTSGKPTQPGKPETNKADTKSKKTNPGQQTEASGNPGQSQTAGSTVTNNTQTASQAVCQIAAPSDTTSKNSQVQCSDQGAQVQDEGRSWWDISVVVPLTGYKDLTFQQGTSTTSSSVASTKSITRENAYAVADFFLVPEDLVDPPYLGIPHLALGLPLAKAVLDKPYFAVGETINIPKIAHLQNYFPLSVRPTFGYVYNKVFPTTGAPYRQFKPQWGIEVSIQSVASALKNTSSNSGSKTASTTGATKSASTTKN